MGNIFKLLHLSIIFTLFLTSYASEAKRSQSLRVFSNPICVVGSSKEPAYVKVRILKAYQNELSRKTRHFKENLQLEEKGMLKGSAKYLTYRHFLKMGYSKRQREFGFFMMTLFGEARNLDEQSMAMVAKVINNRKEKYGSYVQTVTKLAQFSSWYYKNLYDNAIMLCPSEKYHKLWNKVYKVALEHFNKNDEGFSATNYYAPFNMSPRYKIPDWSKGKHVVGYGGHVFIVNEDFADKNDELEVIYIPEAAKKLKVRRGKIQIIN